MVLSHRAASPFGRKTTRRGPAAVFTETKHGVVDPACADWRITPLDRGPSFAYTTA
jgi:hypothetical protein